MSYEKTLLVTGTDDAILKEVITLASKIEWNKPTTAIAWKMTPDVGLTFYTYHATGREKFPTPLDAEGMFHVVKSWLQTDEAKTIRDDVYPEYDGDGSYDIGWKINTRAEVDDQYWQIFTVTPYRIYYGK